MLRVFEMLGQGLSWEVTTTSQRHKHIYLMAGLILARRTAIGATLRAPAGTRGIQGTIKVSIC